MDRLFGRKSKQHASPPAASGSSASAAAADSASAMASAVSSSSSSSSSGSSSVLGPPPVLANDPTYGEAISLLNSALRSEDEGDLRRARESYELGLQLLMGVLRALPQEPQHVRARELLRSVIGKYLDKAEAIKNRQTGGNGHVTAAGLAQPQVQRSLSGPHRATSASSSASSSAVRSPATAVRPAAASVSPIASTRSADIDPALRAAIESEILRPSSSRATFANVVGLDEAKQALREAVILPALRPDLFQGVRAPPKGLLLYGPPGNGKSFIASAVAAESGATFFSISASVLVSKHLGEGERLVRALFHCARERSPSIIFVDEIDSILSRRSSEEHEASRRLKTEFLIQMDGVNSNSGSGDGSLTPRVLVLAATNIPEELDDALIRRLPRRIYIGAPDRPARTLLLKSLLSQPSLRHALSEKDIASLAAATEGYSNSDLSALVSDAAMTPLRSLSAEVLLQTPADRLPPVTLEHCTQAMKRIRPSVSAERQKAYKAWSDKQDAM